METHGFLFTSVVRHFGNSVNLVNTQMAPLFEYVKNTTSQWSKIIGTIKYLNVKARHVSATLMETRNLSNANFIEYLLQN